MPSFLNPISTRRRRRLATAAGKAPPAVDCGFGLGGGPQPSSRRVATPPRARRQRPTPPAAATSTLADPPARTVPLPTTTTQRLWELFSYGLRLLLVTRRLHLRGRMPSKTLLYCGRLADSVVRYSHADWKSEQHEEPTCHATICCISMVRPSTLYRTSWHATPRTMVPPFQTSRSWWVRVDYIQPTTASSYSSVTRHCRQQGLTNPTMWGVLLAC